MYLFDTNVFLEILLKQSRASACQHALASLNAERLGWVTSFSLHAIAAILSGARAHTILVDFLHSVRESPYLRCYATTIEEELTIARLLLHLHLDFDDALQYFVARHQKLTLVTLDRDFRGIKDIRVCDPGEME